MQLSYHCPDCHTENNLHEIGCQFEDSTHTAIAAVYIDILSQLVGRRLSRAALIRSIDGWGALHNAVLSRLASSGPVLPETADETTTYALQPADVFRESNLHPHYPPISTVYEHGSVPGCHDNALFAMVAWYEMQDVGWDDTVDHVIEWLHDSGTWERGGFEEATPRAAVENKRHVWREGYGWKRAAKEAVSVLENGSTVSV